MNFPQKIAVGVPSILGFGNAGRMENLCTKKMAAGWELWPSLGRFRPRRAARASFGRTNSSPCRLAGWPKSLYGKIIGNSWDIYYKWRLVWEIHLYMWINLPVWEFIWLLKNYPNLLPSRKMDDKPTNLIPWDALAAVGVRCCKCIMLPPCHHASVGIDGSQQLKVVAIFRDDTLPFCWRMYIQQLAF